jgi:hypothetical protein
MYLDIKDFGDLDERTKEILFHCKSITYHIGDIENCEELFDELCSTLEPEELDYIEDNYKPEELIKAINFEADGSEVFTALFSEYKHIEAFLSIQYRLNSLSTFDQNLVEVYREVTGYPIEQVLDSMKNWSYYVGNSELECIKEYFREDSRLNKMDDIMQDYFDYSGYFKNQTKYDGNVNITNMFDSWYITIIH